MATTLKFDNLNVLDSKRIDVKNGKSGRKYPTPIPYRQYFGEMYISPEEMRSRIDLAEEIEDVMLYILAYWAIATDADLPIDVDEVKRDGIERLTAVVAKHTKLDPYLEKHISDVVNEVVDVTEKHKKEREQELSDEEDDVEKFLKEESGEESKPADYWTSRDRAMLISENEANAFEEYTKYRAAKEEGKTKKTWVTEGDEKVRFTHVLEAEKTIDIDGLFLVGDSYMRFPKDTMYEPSASETVNCRCTCEYK